jgi:hypothetical protein
LNNNVTTLTIRIKLDQFYFDPDLKIRHTLVDTIEERGIGDVWDECMGEDFMEIKLDLIKTPKAEHEIKSILKSLGILELSKLVYED